MEDSASAERGREVLRRAIVNALWESNVRPPFSDEFPAGGAIIIVHVLPPGYSLCADKGDASASLTSSTRRCEVAILDLFTGTDHRMTWRAVWEELERRSTRFGPGTLRTTLARLVREGKLVNHHDHTGYSLPHPIP